MNQQTPIHTTKELLRPLHIAPWPPETMVAHLLIAEFHSDCRSEWVTNGRTLSCACLGGSYVSRSLMTDALPGRTCERTQLVAFIILISTITMRMFSRPTGVAVAIWHTRNFARPVCVFQLSIIESKTAESGRLMRRIEPSSVVN